MKWSTVDISCTYDGYYDTTSSFWFRSDKSTPEDLTRDPGYVGRVKYTDKERWRYEGPFTLRSTELREEDSAEYRFTLKTDNIEWGHSFPGTTLSVTGNTTLYDTTVNHNELQDKYINHPVNTEVYVVLYILFQVCR